MAAAIHAVDGRLNCAPTCAAAADYLARRKIDGIVIDMSVSGALEFLLRVRSGNANKFSVVFACLDSARDSSAVLDAGANFILRKPLDRIGMMQAFAAAVPLMRSEEHTPELQSH